MLKAGLVEEDMFTAPHSFCKVPYRNLTVSPSSLQMIAEEPEDEDDEEDEEGFVGEGGRFHSTHLRLLCRFCDR